uniref:Uncharacterized protein n=1 Tax=Cannabis sativa TaxID=3483 RepID=A0A803QBJ0_CANSA
MEEVITEEVLVEGPVQELQSKGKGKVKTPPLPLCSMPPFGRMTKKSSASVHTVCLEMYAIEAGLHKILGLKWHRLSVAEDSAYVSTDGFSAWRDSSISVDTFSLQTLSWMVHFLQNPQVRGPYFEGILYFYSVKPQSMRTHCKKLGFYKLERVPTLQLSFQIPKPMPRSTESEEMTKKVALCKAFTEAQLKVKGLAITKLLCEHRLIASFQSIDNATKEDEFLEVNWILCHSYPLTEEEKILERYATAYPDEGALRAIISGRDTPKAKMLRSLSDKITAPTGTKKTLVALGEASQELVASEIGVARVGHPRQLASVEASLVVVMEGAAQQESREHYYLE